MGARQTDRRKSEAVNSNDLAVYNDKEMANFVINNRSDVKPLAADIIRYNNKLYIITVVDDFDGSSNELKLTREFGSSSNEF